MSAGAVSSLMALFLDGLVLTAWWAAGTLGVRLLAPRSSRLEQAAAGFPFGAGVYSWLLFLGSWAGIPIRIPFALGLLIVGLIGLGWMAVRHRLEQKWRPSNPAVVWAILAGALAATAAIFAVGTAYSEWDAIAIWSLRGYGVAQEGSVFAAATWGSHRLSYPLNLSLLISVFRLLEGDVLPGSKLIFPAYYFSWLLGTAAFWRRMRVGNASISLGLLILGSVPVFFEHAVVGHANLPMAVYLTLGVYWVLASRPEDSRGLWVAGGLFGLAAWTRIEAPIYIGLTLLALWGGSRLIRDPRISFASIGGPILVLAIPWGLFFWFYGSSVSQAVRAVEGVAEASSSGIFSGSAISAIGRQVAREFLDLKSWGIYLLFCMLTLALRREWSHPAQSRVPFLLLLACVANTVGTLAIFYVSAFTARDLVGWLDRGLDRHLFPGAMLLGAAAVTVVGRRIAAPQPSMPGADARAAGIVAGRGPGSHRADAPSE